ncbi:S8 family peptidase [Ornithinimicrobium sp. Y1847]|uniref:S8 family peptidase n=1 Tax=Ornithinimicrobium sp. Y1847 TaxID=3405419 RepID=UPI003B677199
MSAPGRRRRLLSALTLVALAGASVTTGAHASPADPSTDASSESGSAGATTGPATEPGAQTPVDELMPEEFEDGPYVVIMQEQPVASYDGHQPGYAATKPGKGGKVNPNSAHARKWADKLQEDQDEVIERAEVGEPHTRFDTALNGFAAELTAEQAETLAADPLVLAVVPDEIRELDTVSSPEFLGLSGKKGVWEQIVGKRAEQKTAGRGVVVGVVDSGIRPESPSFADDGHPAPPVGWTGECVTDDEERFPADSCNDKLIGARYFVAGYGIGRLHPLESLSPLDAGGHGTHTASTAAGNYGVRAVIDGQDQGVISGVAPGAHVAAYKACWDGATGGGCATSDTLAAINAAVADGVDVINYSISGTTSNYIDPIEIAFLNAASAGVFVAASSGNSGPRVSTTNHPSPWITTVAASTHAIYEHTLVLGDGRRFIGNSITETMEGPAPFVYAGDASTTEASAANAALCLPGTLDEEKVEGKVVLCDRGVNARAEKSQVVGDAGGLGMALVNVDASGLNSDWHAIPSVHLSHEHRPALLDYARTEGATAQIEAGNEGSSTQVPEVAGFSSRGPSLGAGGDLLKPDLSAPGVDVLAAYSPTYDGHDFMYSSGTSMSSPHIAGLAALMKQAKPDWSPMMIKSAMMTTARDHATDNDPFAGGSGFVEPRRMLDPGLVLDSGADDWWDFLAGQGIVWAGTGEPVSDNPIDASDLNVPSIAIGDLYGVQTVTRTFTDVSGAAGNWHATVEGLEGLDVTVSPDRIRPGRGGSQDVEVTVRNVDAAAKEWSTGSITWTGPANRTVRIPVVVRPAVLDAPSMVTAPIEAESLEIPTKVGVNGQVDAVVTGLFKGLQDSGTAHQTLFFNALDPQNYTYEFDYPAGYPDVRIEVEGDGVHDLDIYVVGPRFSIPLVTARTTARNEVYEGRIIGTGRMKVHVVAKGYEAERIPFDLRVFVMGEGDQENLVLDRPSRTVTAGEHEVWSGELRTDKESPYFGRVSFIHDGEVVDRTTVRIG